MKPKTIRAKFTHKQAVIDIDAALKTCTPETLCRLYRLATGHTLLWDYPATVERTDQTYYREVAVPVTPYDHWIGQDAHSYAHSDDDMAADNYRPLIADGIIVGIDQMGSPTAPEAEEPTTRPMINPDGELWQVYDITRDESTMGAVEAGYWRDAPPASQVTSPVHQTPPAPAGFHSNSRITARNGGVTHQFLDSIGGDSSNYR